jgi:pimeloyl-ACP methyl ester carboxylesterase
MVERSVASFDGTQIWFSDSEGDGPVVVLLHGATMTSVSNFDTYFAAGSDGRIGPMPGPTISSLLRDQGGRVVAIDTRGHGRSGRSGDPERYRGDVHARDVSNVLDALGVAEVDLVGYSMGAMTAARLAGTERRLRSVALCGTGPSFIAGNDDGAVDRLTTLGRCFQGNEWADHPELKGMRACARLDPVHDFDSIGAAMIGMDAVPADCFAKVEVPVLILNGGGDDDDGDAAALAALIPGAVAMVAGAADHNMASSDHDFQAALVSWLQQQWPTT